MTTQETVQKLWNLCNILWDDGITYHQYLTELTYLLFLKMAEETGMEINKFSIPSDVSEAEMKAIQERLDNYSAIGLWQYLIKKDGIELKRAYVKLLDDLGNFGTGLIKDIYQGAETNIEEPANLNKLVTELNKLDWYTAREEGLGDMYEGLLQKNAEEKKSGAGQYFTPRPLINVMTRLVKPQLKEKCFDPAAGTFGFMIAANTYVRAENNNYDGLKQADAEFQMHRAFIGVELVNDARRLAMMNARLHNLESDIVQGDFLSSVGEQFKESLDVILTNPPFGTKKGGERPLRKDLTFPTTNKQFNFLQAIYKTLNKDGNARAAVVLPDNVLFQDGDGMRIRKDLMDKCNLHTILRLPTGIFYAQGVKTNVLFFTRGKEDRGNTKEVCFYDMRTNMPNFGKRTQFIEDYFDEFETTFFSSVDEKIKLERWSCFSIDQLAEKNYNLDLGLIKDSSMVGYDDLPDPVESADAAIAALEQAADLLRQVQRELELCEKAD